MNLMFGVSPILIEEQNSIDELSHHIIKRAYDKNYVNKGDLTVLTAGIPFGVSGSTNFLKAQFVDETLNLNN